MFEEEKNNSDGISLEQLPTFNQPPEIEQVTPQIQPEVPQEVPPRPEPASVPIAPISPASLPEAEDSPEEELHVMSGKFRKAKPKMPAGPGKGGKKINLLIIGMVILLVAVGVTAFYLWNRGYFQKKQPTVPPVSEVKEQPEKTPKVEEVKEEPSLSLEKTLKKELKNEADEIVSWAEFYLPEGAIDLDADIELNGNLLSEEEASKYEDNYKAISGLYNLKGTKEETELAFKKPCSLKIFYDKNLIEEDWKQDLTIGYFKDDIWTPFSSSLDEEKSEITINLEYLPADTWAIIIEKAKITPKVEAFQIAPNTPSSADTDKDGLTDVEEGVYKTEINNPDSDADANPDGQEVVNLADPTQVNESKLAASSLINVYTNSTYSYSFFYPGSWLARAIPETDNQEVLVITNTGEFFSATVENNPEKLSPKDWYLRQSPHADESLLYSTLVNNQEAVWNPEHLTIYIAKDDRVYILSYNVGTEEEANFKTTFEMLINSFQFVTQPQGRSDGTLIKYPDQPGIYLIEAGKKRAFASGEIFEKLGFKWEDVIEIPYSETYIDGELITGRLNGTLIKYSDQPGIYLIQGGKKRAFASGEIFEKLGFKWEDVIEIPVEEIYPDGAIIDSNVTTSQIK